MYINFNTDRPLDLPNGVKKETSSQSRIMSNQVEPNPKLVGHGPYFFLLKFNFEPNITCFT